MDGRSIFGRLLGPAALAGVVLLTVPVAAGAAGLSKADRGLLAKALVQRERVVTLLVAVHPGAAADVTARLRALGATVAYREDDVGYVRADVPAGRAVEAAALAGVAAVSLDQVVAHGDPAVPSDDEPALPGPDTPAANPLVPTQDIGAPQFVAAHPTFDGRGTTLGIVDDGVDLLTPELQRARLADGTVVDKVVDYVAATDPADDPTWVDMTAQVKARNGSVAFAGTSYGVPRNGGYRIGLLDERAPGSPLPDLNRDGNPPGSSRFFAVLWEASTNRVWVDTDQDASFADQQPMTDYRARHDVGTFGTDLPGTAVRETVPFAVQTDARRKLVNVIVESQLGHGTNVASVGVGAGFFGGDVDGAAPGARLAVARTNYLSSSNIEGILYLAKHARVDAINLSYGSMIPAGSDPEGVVIERVVERFGIPVFAAAGNDRMAAGTVASPSAMLRVLSVGASATRETTSAVAGYDIGSVEGIEWFSSRGPSIEGPLKPDLSAPGLTWAALPGWQRSEPGAPQGYAVVRGTSLSTPIAAGGALLLLSGARQSGVQAGEAALRQALLSSARWLPAASAHEQGRGVLSVDGAWDLLRRGVKPVQIDVSAPVVNAWSIDGTISPTGAGLYEREGWTAGQTGTRSITLVRRTGAAAPITYRLGLSGNDGTFSAPATVRLARGVATAVTVGIAPVSFGVHAAFLDIDDPATVGMDGQAGLTVIAAQPFDDAFGYAVEKSGAVANDSVADYFFSVPAAAFSFDTELTSPSDSAELSWSIAGPYGPEVTIDNPFPPFGAIFPFTIGCWVPSPSFLCARPPSGRVWEYAISTAFQAAPTTPFTLRAGVRGYVAVTPSPVVVDPAVVGTTSDATLEFATGEIGFEGRARGSDLGPLFAQHTTLTPGDFLADQFEVPAGTTRVVVEVGGATDPDADLDLTIFHCIDDVCSDSDFEDRSVTPTSTEWVEVEDPQPGMWVAFVDALEVPSGSTELDYAHVATDPTFGSVSIDDADAFHPAFDHWQRTIHVTALAVPDGGAALRGYVRVPGGWTDIDVRNVMP